MITFASQLVHLVSHALVIKIVIQDQVERPSRGCGCLGTTGPAATFLRWEQPLPAAAGQEPLPARLAGGGGGGQRLPGDQRLQEPLQALQQLPPALLPARQLRREAAEG